MKISTLIALSTLNILLLSAAAQAGETVAVRSAKVSFADLNLASAAGDAELYKRVKTAAIRVCDAFDPRDRGTRFYGGTQYAVCVNSALEEAVARINVPQFTAYVSDHFKNTAPVRLAAQ